MMKKSINKKPKQQKTAKVPRLVGLGRAEFEMILHLPEDALTYYNTDWSKINEISDLAFLKENKDLWDRIQFVSTNSLINTLLFINKSHSSKSFVEWVLMKPLHYSEKEEFLKDIIGYVTEHNFLFLFEADILESESHLTFTLKCGKKSKSFRICESEKVEKAEIGMKPQVKTEEDQKEHEEVEKKERTAEEGPFEKLTIEVAEYDYLFVDLEEFVPYMGENPEILTHFANFLQKKVVPHQNLKLVMSYPDLIKSITNFDLNTVNIISELLSASDITISDKKPAYSLFKMLHKISNVSDSSSADLEEKEVPNYFAYGIKPTRAGPRLGIFINDFQKLNVIETINSGNANKIIFQNEYDFQLYPKINHTNQKLVSDYRALIGNHYSELKSVFLGGLLSRVVSSTSKNMTKEFLTAFLTGSEASKRILELHKNKLDLPPLHEFYVVKISQSKIEKELEKEELKKKESKFVLDCVNKNTSNLKYYNPLFDDHLNSFFASEVIRKQLKSKGFINTNGFIMYDANYRACMGASPKRKRFDEEEKEKQLLYAIKSINVADDPQDKSHFDSYSRMMNSNSPTNRKLPSVQFEYSNILAKSTSTKTSKKKLKPIGNII